MLPERPRTPDRPRLPALTDAECSVVDHYLAVVDLLARINPARGRGHTYTALRAAQSLATEARDLLAAYLPDSVTEPWPHAAAARCRALWS